jgi:uncharacterized protein YcnI
MSFHRNSLAIALACTAAAAQAHIHLEYAVAPAGSTYKASFQVGHGCGASPTRQFIIEIPPGVRSARPMPKAGWQLDVRREPLAPPVTHRGRTVTEDVTSITWTARGRDDMLASAHYDEFVLVATLPQQAGPLFWPVRQVCEEGRHDWVEVPAPGARNAELKSPAPQLDILPSGPGAGHHH